MAIDPQLAWTLENDVFKIWNRRLQLKVRGACVATIR